MGCSSPPVNRIGAAFKSTMNSPQEVRLSGVRTGPSSAAEVSALPIGKPALRVTGLG
jgi:hypothetical protein